MLYVKNRNASFLGSELERHLHRDWKHQREFAGKVRTCPE